jgi:hypothetical protein
LVSYDLHDKFHVYRRSGVREYVVWRVEDEAVDWFVLREGQFVPLPRADDGILGSEVFPGLWLDPAAITRGDLSTVIRVAQQGLDSQAHAEFVARLKADAARIAQNAAESRGQRP